jgi:iron complex outermembrane receptor protein
LFPRVTGNRGFDSEKLIAVQVGHRTQLMSRVFLDTVVFYHNYEDLLSIEPGTPFIESSPPPDRLVLPFSLRNKLHGESYGFEVAADALVTDYWRLRSGYSFLQLDLERDGNSQDPSTAPNTQGSSPHNQFFLHSELDLPWDVSLDSNLRYVDNVPAQGTPSYVTFDVRLAWAATSNIELAIVGQNLAQNHHREFAGGTQVERAGYGQVRFQW